MRFAEPENLILFFAVILIGLVLFWSISNKKKLLAKFGDLPLIMKNAPYISFARQRTKALLAVITLCLLVLALARIQFGTHTELLKREGLDIVIALDVSTSMLAQDMKPTRLGKAKQEIMGIIERLKGDRVALVAFAGEAFIQCPLTLDYAAATFMLNSVDNNSVSIQGTNLSAALEMATKAFNQKEKKHKVMLLLTDGEDHSKNTLQLAKVARTEGIKIYTVGIGSPAGEPIPILDRRGKQVGFKKDETGEIIISKLDDAILKKISLETGGKYYQATAGEIELDKIFEEISKMEKKELEGTQVTRYDDRFQIPMFFVLILLLIEFLMSERKLKPKRVTDV